jgi:hypothetical protein
MSLPASQFHAAMKNRTMAWNLERARVQAREARIGATSGARAAGWSPSPEPAIDLVEHTPLVDHIDVTVSGILYHRGARRDV